jgi:UDP:flavonoid glycosyltransferase YjiC (YdhE family)
LRAAGHDVLFAGGGQFDEIARAGLSVVDTAPAVDFVQLFSSAMGELGSPDPGSPADQLLFAGRLFARVSSVFVDLTVSLAREWRPDLVIYTPLQGAGPIAAAVVGVPSIAHGIAVGQGRELWESVAREMASDYDRFDVSAPAPDGVLDVSPPSMRAADSSGWPMRYVPYNAGAVLPRWVVSPRARRRVVVTLGSVLPQLGGVGALRPFVAAAGKVDAEFVLALGGADLSELGSLPDNVRPVDWVPLGELLANSDAVVHHGGAGTTLTAVAAGLPQLVLPRMADQFLNAQAVARAGVGAVVRPEELDAERLSGLLTDEAAGAAARRIVAEMAGQPSPAELVSRLVSVLG